MVFWLLSTDLSGSNFLLEEGVLVSECFIVFGVDGGFGCFVGVSVELCLDSLVCLCLNLKLTQLTSLVPVVPHGINITSESRWTGEN